MIVDILTIIAVYLGIAWSIYMSLIFRREYKKVKDQAVKKVDDILDRAQVVSKELKYSMLGLAGILGMIALAIVIAKYTPG